MVLFKSAFKCVQLGIHSYDETTQRGFTIGSYLFLVEFDSNAFLVGDGHSYSFVVIELIRGIRIVVQAVHRFKKTRSVVLLNADRRIETSREKQRRIDRGDTLANVAYMFHIRRACERAENVS